MKSLSDEQLMEIFHHNRDSQGQFALDCLYHRYAKLLLNYFYFSLQNDYDKAQDFVHDLFIKIIEKHQSFDSKQQFKPWIFRIASNMCKNEYRNFQVFQRYKNHIVSTMEIIERVQEKEKLLRSCIGNLSQEHRSLIVLRFKLQLSVKEIAGIYECPEGTVKSRLFYAVKELSKLYKM